MLGLILVLIGPKTLGGDLGVCGAGGLAGVPGTSKSGVVEGRLSGRGGCIPPLSVLCRGGVPSLGMGVERSPACAQTLTIACPPGGRAPHRFHGLVEWRSNTALPTGALNRLGS